MFVYPLPVIAKGEKVKVPFVSLAFWISNLMRVGIINKLNIDNL